MALFVQVGSGTVLDSGFFNAAFVAAIRYTSTTVVTVSLMNPNTATDVVTITMSSADTSYETHGIIAQTIISAAQVQKTGIVTFPQLLPGNRTLTIAIA